MTLRASSSSSATLLTNAIRHEVSDTPVKVSAAEADVGLRLEIAIGRAVVAAGVGARGLERAPSPGTAHRGRLIWRGG